MQKKYFITQLSNRLIAEPAASQKHFALLTEPTNHNKTNLKIETIAYK
jgi:hypothetical protein